MAEGSPSSSRYANAVYYASWRIYRKRPPSSLNLQYISHIFYAFARVRADGTVYLMDEWADTQIAVDGTKGCLAACGLLKQKKPQLKLLLSIGGGSGSEHFATLASDPHARQQFGKTAKELVQRFNLDGIDVDWEHPATTEQGHDYVRLLATVREHLPCPNYLLTSALPAGEWVLRHIDLQASSALLDLLNLMTYDFAGPWTELSGHQSQLFTPPNPYNAAAKRSCDSGVGYLESRGVSQRKILLGVPAYGRSFLGADGPGQSFSGAAGEGSTFEYRDLPRPGAKESVDENLGAAYSLGGDAGFLSYDNPTTVSMKGAWVKNRGLAGLFFWTGNADTNDDDRSLVKAGYVALHST